MEKNQHALPSRDCFPLQFCRGCFLGRRCLSFHSSILMKVRCLAQSAVLGTSTVNGTKEGVSMKSFGKTSIHFLQLTCGLANRPRNRHGLPDVASFFRNTAMLKSLNIGSSAPSRYPSNTLSMLISLWINDAVTFVSFRPLDTYLPELSNNSGEWMSANPLVIQVAMRSLSIGSSEGSKFLRSPPANSCIDDDPQKP